MNWIEILHLRAHCGIMKELPVSDLKQIAGRIKNARFSGMQIFRHAEYSTDISIHLNWSAASGVPHKSEIGTRLCMFLKRFGLVSHYVWIDMENVPGMGRIGI